MDEIEAYKAMQIFLEKIYNRTSSDDIGALLGDMIIQGDGKPSDVAIWDDWISAIEKAKEEKNQNL